VNTIRRLKYILVAAIGAWALSGTPVCAQQQPTDTQQEQQPMAPIPAMRSPLASGADNGDDEAANSQELAPDTRSLTGVEDLSLGTMRLTHSYWQPFASVSVTVDSNPEYLVGNSGWGTWTSAFGGVTIDHTSGASDIQLNYLGGGMYSNGGGAQNGVIQELTFKDRVLLRRSTFTVFEQLAYLPQSSFGFAGATGAGIPGGGGSNLGNNFTPGASILTPPGQNLSSSTALEWDTKLTPRTSLTFVGSYVLLHYFEEGLANYGDAIFQAGYNYQVTRKDTIAVSYLFNAIRYTNADQSINTNTIQGSYARRVTGRLAFQIAAGPQFVSSTFPITNSTTASTTTPGSVSKLYWALSSSLQYQLHHAMLSASYSHGINGGSGLLTGAETDVVSGTVSQQVSRTFHAAWNVGYSRNSGYAVATTTTAPEQTYSYWFAGVNVTHPMGRSLDLFVNYQWQYQDNGTNGCTGTACTANVIRNEIAFGLNLHKQPIPF
jgi:hypothetical protein